MFAGEEAAHLLWSLSLVHVVLSLEIHSHVSSKKKSNGIRQRAKQNQWQSTETGGQALDEATFTIRTLRVMVDTDSSMLDDSTPHVFTKSDIMLIQSEMLEDISKYRDTHTHTIGSGADTNLFLLLGSLCLSFSFHFLFSNYVLLYCLILIFTCAYTQVKMKIPFKLESTCCILW